MITVCVTIDSLTIYMHWTPVPTITSWWATMTTCLTEDKKYEYELIWTFLNMSLLMSCNEYHHIIPVSRSKASFTDESMEVIVVLFIILDIKHFLHLVGAKRLGIYLQYWKERMCGDRQAASKRMTRDYCDTHLHIKNFKQRGRKYWTLKPARSFKRFFFLLIIIYFAYHAVWTYCRLKRRL